MRQRTPSKSPFDLEKREPMNLTRRHLKVALKFALFPFALSAIVGFSITAVDVILGAEMARGFLHAAAYMITPVTVVPLLLSLTLRKSVRDRPASTAAKAWPVFAIVWKSYIVTLCMLLGVVAGTATVTLYLSHRVGLKP
jgi:hypothetical protein